MMASEQKCGNCRFMSTRGRGQPVCLRYPPTVHPMGGSGFPDTETYIWCGEWRPKDVVSEKGKIERLQEIIENINDLNLTQPDEMGNRWAHSDLINQEIIAARMVIKGGVMRDFFGNELTEEQALRQMKRKSTPKKGYAALPGTGPDGETCGSCKHLYRNRRAKTYLKCALMRRHWTGGAGTDVLARAPACRHWEAK